MEEKLKLGKFLIFLPLFLYLIFPSFQQTYSYTLTHNVAVEYASNVSYIIKCSLSGASPSGKKVSFEPDWLLPKIYYTDAYGNIEINVTMPSPGPHQIKFVSPDSPALFQTVSASFTVKKGITPVLSYSSVQYFDPETTYNDILISATAQDTYSKSGISLPNWDVITISTPVLTNWKVDNLGAGTFLIRIDLTSKVGGVFKYTIKPSYTDYISVPVDVTVLVGSKAILKVKYVFSDGTSGWFNEEQSAMINKETTYLDIYIYNTKNTLLSASLTQFLIGVSDIPEIVPVSPGHFRVNYDFYPVTFTTLTISAKYVNPYYQEFNAQLKVSTVTLGFDIWKFITSPFILVPILLIVLYIGIKIFRRKKPIETF